MGSGIDRDKLRRRAEMYRGGMSLKRMAYEEGVSVNSISAYLTSHRDELPRRVDRVTQDTVDRMQQLRDDGIGNRGIARELGISPTTVINHIGPMGRKS